MPPQPPGFRHGSSSAVVPESESKRRSKNLTRSPHPGSSRGVRCSRCGRDNPESLRFCQDCGGRLSSASQQLAPDHTAKVSGAPVAGRPEAPTFGFASRAEPPRNCPRCDHAVSASDSFCPDCGGALGHGSSLISAVAKSSLPPANTGASVITSPKMASVPATAADTQQQAICPKCNRHNPIASAFCLDCGYMLTNHDGRLRPSLSAPFGVDNKPTPSVTQRPVQSDNGAARPATKPSAVVPSLVVIAQDGTVGRVYPVTDTQVDIGRTEGAICIPDDRFICPRHARLLRNGRSFTIQDLNSVNGIYRRVRGSVPLDHGDTLLLGLAVLRFEVLAPGEQRLNAAVERGTQVFGSPSGPRYARLTERTVEGAPRSVFVLTREESILGREVGDIVFSSDPFMSRRHAAITRSPSDGSFTLLDLGSSNGTFLRIRGQAELVPGDHLRVGQHLFRFDHEDGQGQAQAR